MRKLLPIALAMALGFAAAAQETGKTWDLSQNGIALTVAAEADRVSLTEDFIVTVAIETPPGESIPMPDLRSRFKGFRVAEDFEEPPEPTPDGGTRMVSRWRLVPEPGAKKYRLAPFAVGNSFWTRNITFEPPAPLPPAAGAVEVAPTPDAPPFTWERFGIVIARLLAAALACVAGWYVLAAIRKAIRIHRMSPIERARYELDELLKARLPEQGLFKDFYVRLTMVVRRYISRKHLISAPQLTTDEFLRQAAESPAFDAETIAKLKRFLESADLVKFAGLKADLAMAGDAVASARDYLASSESRPGRQGT